MDKLKQYLQQHRAELDFDLPPVDVWQNTQTGSRKTVVKRFPLLLRCAAAMLVLTIGSVVWLMTTKNSRQQVARLPIKETFSQNKTESVLQKADNQKQSPQADPVASVKSRKTPLPERPRLNPSKPVLDEVTTLTRSYTNLIGYQIQRLRRTPVYVESPAYFTEFVGQLTQMDKDEQAITSDVKRYGINDQLLESLMDIYQQKLNLLKSLQKEIKQMNRTVEGKPATNKVLPYYLTL